MSCTCRNLEKKLDRIFSEYIRLSRCNGHGYCQCITCGSYHFWKDIHNGHSISRSVKATRFNEINCNPQCVRCNSYRQGEHHIYRDRLIEIHGKKMVEALEYAARLGGSETSESLQMKINEYGKKVKQLKKDKAL
jgi:hypothetical protein